MSVLEFSRDALSTYGQSGDKSLEYIGIIISCRGVLEKRVYRKNCEAVLKDVSQTPPYKHILQEILPQFYNYDGIKLCDISCSHISSAPTYRVVFKLPKRQTLSDLYKSLEVFFRCIPDNTSYKERLYEQLRSITNERNCHNSPLLQIGTEFDGNHRLRSLKYYISIDSEKADDKNDLLAEFGLNQKHQIICENGYKPIFIGINDTDGIEEHKVYYISKALGFKTASILESTEKLAVSLGWDQMIAFDEFRQLYDMGLYAEGIAIPVHKGEMWRLYFREFTKRLSGRSTAPMNSREGE